MDVDKMVHEPVHLWRTSLRNCHLVGWNIEEIVADDAPEYNDRMASDGIDDDVRLLRIEVVETDLYQLHLGGHLPHLRFKIEEQAQIYEGGGEERRIERS
jgi:hypothetical protein